MGDPRVASPIIWQSGGSLERSRMDAMRDLVAAGGSLRCWRRTTTGSLVSLRTTDLG
jgi:hypothetical protein